MHHYEVILSHLTQSEAQLDEALNIANDNHGRGITEDDVVRIADVRNHVNYWLSWFKRSFENRI